MVIIKKNGMIDIKHPRCKNDWCDTIVNKKYEGYCMPCFVNNPENADKPAMRNYKTKELEVVNHIKNILKITVGYLIKQFKMDVLEYDQIYF